MKNLTKKDLELNPNIVTGLTGSGEQPKDYRNASEDSVCTAECGQSEEKASCNNDCQTVDQDCTGNVCLNTLETCNVTIACNPTQSNAAQCCATDAGNCPATNYACPATNNCQTAFGCVSTTVVCEVSEDCPPVFPAETIGC